MAYATATLVDVTHFGGRSFSLGDYRRVVLRGVAIGLGSVAAAGVTAAFIAVAVAWMAAAFHSANPNIQARASITAETIALANPYGTQATALFGSARAVNVPDSAPDMAFDTQWERVTAQTFAPTNSAPLLSYRSFKNVANLPSPQPLSPPSILATNPPNTQVTHNIARVSDVTREAELSPPAAPMSAPNSSVPLPPRRTVEPTNSVALPQLDSLSGPNLQAKQDIARPPIGPATPKVAAIPPTPPASGSLSFFQKLFGSRQADNGSIALPGPDSRTAVYDIEAHTVYLPNGDRLEAHSGMGEWLDDPRSVNVKNQGATPPHVYDLVLRESLFHGVQAVRLNPVGGGNMFGRDGILAHSYMLGPNGQSNGCVSFKDYPEFLRAYLNGEVERLVVVPHLGSKPLRAARSRQHADRYAFNSR